MTAPNNIHTEANEYDAEFLDAIAGHLDGATVMARAHLDRGQHPDVTALAGQVLAGATDQIIAATGLSRSLKDGSNPAGSGKGAGGKGKAAVTTTVTGVSGGSGHGNGNGNGNGNNSARPGGEARAAMSAQQENNLPDSAFAYIEAGGTKDAGGKTTPRSLRHFPIHDKTHVQNALARASQSPFGPKAMPAIKAAAKKFGVDVSGYNSQSMTDTILYRSVPFELDRGDGQTLEGYAAVFDSPTRIDSWEGEFDETITRGAFARSLEHRSPVLMFEHGRHPLIGSMPLGVITRAQEDSKGLYIQARLSDNWLIAPVRDAVRDGAVTGMSFRFQVPEGGDTVLTRSGNVPLRTINQADVSELGPVVFPAYEPTTATVRSLLERFDFTGRPATRSSGGGEPSTDPGGIAVLNMNQLLDDGALRARKVL